MTSHLEFEQWVPFPVEIVFGFFSNPANLPRIMPTASGTRLDRVNLVSPLGTARTDAAGVGTTIATSFRIIPFLPFRARWIARITEFERNHHFADIQDQGPFKSWHHRHEFLSETRQNVQGTLVRDVIDYEVGFGPLGSVANSLFVRRQMKATFDERQAKLPRLLQQ